MISRATAADAEAVCDVHRASRRAAYAHLGSVEQIDGAVRLERWRELLAGDESTTWVDERDGAVVAFASLEGVVLRGLYVLPEAQGSGAGSALLDAAVDAGARELWVHEANARARGFYERRGWVAEPGTLRVDPGWSLRAPALHYRLEA